MNPSSINHHQSHPSSLIDNQFQLSLIPVQPQPQPQPQPQSDWAELARELCRASLSAPTFDVGQHCLGNVRTCYEMDKEEGNDTSFYHQGIIARAIAHLDTV